MNKKRRPREEERSGPRILNFPGEFRFLLAKLGRRWWKAGLDGGEEEEGIVRL